MKILLLILNILFNNIDIERNQYGVWCECVQQEILFCDIVVQQSTTETRNGLTGVGKTKNNIFGFRNKSGYMNFKTIRESINYYKVWQDKNYPKHLEVAHKTSNCDYYHFIEAIGYKTGKPYSSSEKSYTRYLKRIKINFK